MATIKEIFNGDPENGSSNIPRSVMAFAIPMVFGYGGAIIQNVTSPELGIVPPIVTMIVPVTIGILEMLRQFRITDKKNDEMDRRFFGNLKKLRRK
ncbi:MAG: hypothetical protein WC741_03445 [Patescibacteria group bacterium]|jgi:hypothetical protein